MHRIRRWGITAGALAVTLASPGCGSTHAGTDQGNPAPAYGHVGRWLVDGAGRVVIAHGLNMVAKLPPYKPEAIGFGDADAAFLARAGFNALRLGIIVTALEPEPGQFNDAYLASIARTAAVLERHGIAPLLDFHQDMYNERFQGEGFPNWMVQDDGLPARPRRGFPGNYTFMRALARAYDHFWANSPGPGGTGLQDYYAGAWEHVASYFSGDAGLLGYEIFNEPFPGSVPASALGKFASGPLAALDRRTFAAMRRADPAHLVFYEPALQFSVGFTDRPPAPADARAGFAFHVYCSAFPQPACRARELKGIRAAEAQARASGDALLLSEFGATDRLTTLASVEELADRERVPWLEWSFWNRDPSGPREHDGLVLNLRRPLSGANVKWAKLRMLARPYPRVVAGVPEQYGFDPRTSRFELRYSTAPAGGGTFAPGTHTLVSVPQVEYPHGYRVSAVGATVVSAPGAEILALVAAPGATEARVQVRPSAARSR